MPARRKHPTALMDRRPSRLRTDPPTQTDPIGNAPAHLTDEQLDAWREIVEGAPMGVLSSADRLAVEQAARLIAQSRTDPKFTVSAGTLLAKLLQQFGLTPSGRLGLQVPLVQAPPKRNPFAMLDDDLGGWEDV